MTENLKMNPAEVNESPKWLTMLRFHITLDKKIGHFKMFFPANHLAWLQYSLDLKGAI